MAGAMGKGSSIKWQVVYEFQDCQLLVASRPDWLTDRIVDHLWGLSLEERPEIEIFGKKAHMNRSIGFFSDQSEGYRYSGQISRSVSLTPELKDLLQEMNLASGSEYNGMLINKYQTGADYIGAHRDDEKNLDDIGVIAISLGAGRIFRLREYKTKKKLFDYQMKDGDLIWMKGKKFHQLLTHEIPKQLRVKEARLSVTFRKHLK